MAELITGFTEGVLIGVGVATINIIVAWLEGWFNEEE